MLEDEFERRRKRRERVLSRASAIVSEFVGLSAGEARRHARDFPDLMLEICRDGAAVTADLRLNRIRAFVRDGRIVSAAAG